MSPLSTLAVRPILKPAFEVEGDAFDSTVIYWTGVFEEKFNAEFIERMQAGKTVIPRWRTLSILAEKDGMRVAELASYTRIERSALSHLLVEMEKEDLVQRRQIAEDRRLVHVYLTELGWETYRAMLPVRRQIFGQAAARIQAADIAVLRSSLHALVEGLDAMAAVRKPR
jgi:DNA-binding MarR family transcriptional regulator